MILEVNGGKEKSCRRKNSIEQRTVKEDVVDATKVKQKCNYIMPLLNRIPQTDNGKNQS